MNHRPARRIKESTVSSKGEEGGYRKEAGHERVEATTQERCTTFAKITNGVYCFGEGARIPAKAPTAVEAMATADSGIVLPPFARKSIPISAIRTAAPRKQSKS